MTKISKLFTSFKEFFVTYRSTLKIAWAVDKKAIIKITVVNAIIGALVYPSLLTNKLLIDTVINAVTTHEFQKSILILTLVMSLQWLIGRLTDVLQDIDFLASFNLPRYISEKIGVNVAQKINALPVSTAEDPHTRDLQQKVLDNVGRSVWSLITPISTFPEILFTLISTLIPIITFQPIFILPTIILSIPSVIIGMRYSREQHTLNTTSSSKWRVWSALEDFSIKGKYLYENKILNHTNILLKRREQMAKDYFGGYDKINTAHVKRRQLSSIPLSLYETGTLFYLYYLAVIGKLSLGSAQITSSAIDRFISNFGRIIRQANDIFQNYLFVQDYETFMSLPEENLTHGTSFPEKISHGIEFQHVWFKYPLSKDWILKDISFKIDPSDNIAIVGQNGAGKTTLIKLLCRFYEPQKGRILVDGLDIYKYKLSEYRFQISALFQDFAQYPFSVEDNIHFGDISQKKSHLRIKHAAKLTGITHFINSLPLKYQNPLDKEFENGVEPSKGLWQRVALARTLYRHSEILILDEPTSNVDPQSEEEIFDQVLRVAKEKIIILISHRFSTVRKADKILVLENGSIIEYGTHHELMNKKGRYKELFDIQAESFR